MAQMKSAGGIYIPYMVLIKKIYTYICITAYGDFKVVQKIRASCFHQTGVFGGSGNLTVPFKFTPDRPVATATNRCMQIQNWL